MLRRATAPGLGKLARDTGGALISGTGEFSAGLRRVEEDLQTHYVLAYTPKPASAWDGGYRRVEVEVHRDGLGRAGPPGVLRCAGAGAHAHPRARGAGARRPVAGARRHRDPPAPEGSAVSRRETATQQSPLWRICRSEVPAFGSPRATRAPGRRTSRSSPSCATRTRGSSTSRVVATSCPGVKRASTRSRSAVSSSSGRRSCLRASTRSKSWSETPSQAGWVRAESPSCCSRLATTS